MRKMLKSVKTLHFFAFLRLFSVMYIYTLKFIFLSFFLPIYKKNSCSIPVLLSKHFPTRLFNSDHKILIRGLRSALSSSPFLHQRPYYCLCSAPCAACRLYVPQHRRIVRQTYAICCASPSSSRHSAHCVLAPQLFATFHSPVQP